MPKRRAEPAYSGLPGKCVSCRPTKAGWVIGRKKMELLEREEHLRRLDAALAQAALGRGRLFAISGEAGAGKTTLIEAFSSGQAAANIYRGACENLSTPEPLLPLRDIARAGDTQLDLSKGNVAAFENLLSMLGHGTKPALLIVEDVHWADAATLDMIRFLARRIAGVKALVLVTYRDDEVGARSPLRDALKQIPLKLHHSRRGGSKRGPRLC
ncbi:MAG: AAA family ATPase [Alphaproteobacteria bacterium]|nr:AAA family ATPase [Alphaproteobacteria bacterium]